MRSKLGDSSLIQNGDLIAILDRAKTMGHNERRPGGLLLHVVEGCLNDALALVVERGRGLVED